MAAAVVEQATIRVERVQRALGQRLERAEHAEHALREGSRRTDQAVQAADDSAGRCDVVGEDRQIRHQRSARRFQRRHCRLRLVERADLDELRSAVQGEVLGELIGGRCIGIIGRSLNRVLRILARRRLGVFSSLNEVQREFGTPAFFRRFGDPRRADQRDRALPVIRMHQRAGARLLEYFNQRIAGLDIVRANDDRFDREGVVLLAEILGEGIVTLRILVHGDAPADLRIRALDTERDVAERTGLQALAPGGDVLGHGVTIDRPASTFIGKRGRLLAAETEDTRPSWSTRTRISPSIFPFASPCGAVADGRSGPSFSAAN